MAHCETLPNGVVVRVTQSLSDEERAALSDYFDALRDAAEERLAALSPEERANLEARQKAGAARLRRMRERAAEDA
jgi:cytochrome c553